MTQTPINPLGRPEQPKKFRPRITEDPNHLEISFAKRDWGLAVFMLFWLMPWSAGCLAMLNNALAGQKLFIFFGIPFWLAWFFVVFGLFDALLRVETLIIDRQAARYNWRVLFNLQNTTYLVQNLRPVNNTQPEQDRNGTYRVKLRGRDKDLLFFRGLKEEEARWLQPIINAHLARIVGYEAGSEQPQFQSVAPEQDVQSWYKKQGQESDEGSTHSENAQDSGDEENWILEGQVARRPDGTKWEIEPSFQELSLLNKGQFSAKTFLFLLIFTLFWDGVVFTVAGAHLGLFSSPGTPTKGNGEWWFVAIFLTPFVLVGLVMVVLLLGSLFAGAYKKRWMFGYRGVQYKAGYLGLGTRQEWDVVKLQGLQIKKGSLAKLAQTAGPTDLQQYDLALIDRTGKEICRVRDLSIDEARWIGSLVMNSRKEWFR